MVWWCIYIVVHGRSYPSSPRQEWPWRSIAALADAQVTLRIVPISGLLEVNSVRCLFWDRKDQNFLNRVQKDVADQTIL
jgi:hypothetical protein